MSIITEVPLADPLSEVTRRERKYLLGISVIGLFVSYSGAIPTKIAALGIELTTSNQESFLVILALIIIYFLIAFCIYGVADFLIWRKAYQKLLENGATELLTWDESDQRRYDEIHEQIPRADWVYVWSKPTAYIRAAFEFLVPITFAIYAAIVVIAHSYRI